MYRSAESFKLLQTELTLLKYTLLYIQHSSFELICYKIYVTADCDYSDRLLFEHFYTANGMQTNPENDMGIL